MFPVKSFRDTISYTSKTTVVTDFSAYKAHTGEENEQDEILTSGFYELDSEFPWCVNFFLFPNTANPFVLCMS